MRDQLQSVDILIPTYRPDSAVKMLIDRLLKQSHPIRRIIIMNTEEAHWIASGLARYVEGMNQVEVHHITKAEFDHGKTRDIGMGYSDAEIVICMTQDAMPARNSLVARLLEAFQDPQVVMAYGCQLSNQNSNIIEQYTRKFNYPDYDLIKSKDDLEVMGIKTYFASNVCAAYRKETYLQLGGFIKKTIFNEDMIFAAGVIQKGYKIAYCSSAQVIHSHQYTCMQQFRRNFDLAVSQADHPEIFAHVSSEGEGIRLVKSTAKFLISKKKIFLLPQLLMVSGFKFWGYQMGKHYRKFPKEVVRFCTMNPQYWIE